MRHEDTKTRRRLHILGLRAFVPSWLETLDHAVHSWRSAASCSWPRSPSLPLVLNAYWINLLTLALIYSLAVYSINLLTGFTGLLSFGQAGFVGVGAYTYGVLSVAGLPPAIAAVAGMLLPTVVGALLALPAARLRGQYLAIGTLGFGVLVAQLLNNLVDVTRGPMGLLGIGSMGVSRSGWYYVALVLSLLDRQRLDHAGAPDLSRPAAEIGQARRDLGGRVRRRRVSRQAVRVLRLGADCRLVRRAARRATSSS